MRDYEIHVEAVDWHESAEVLADLRREVFVAEQGIDPRAEFDGRDPVCVHLAAWRSTADGRELIGTARLEQNGRLGRMAVRAPWRGRGAGSLLLRHGLEEADRLGLARVLVHAQSTAAKFYHGRGFFFDGPEFIEAGLSHRAMLYALDGIIEPMASEFTHGPLLRDRLARNMKRFSPRSHYDADKRRAGVALAIVANDAGQACFVLTKRQAKLRRHGGQWALPGGSADEGETPTDAARRELREEVALESKADDILGVLDDYETRSGFVITPVVLWAADDAVLEPDQVEVAGIYRVPLSLLEHPEVPQLRSIPQSNRPLISLPILGTKIHAPTAALVYQLREAAVHGRSTRVNGFEQPVFAWR